MRPTVFGRLWISLLASWLLLLPGSPATGAVDPPEQTIIQSILDRYLKEEGLSGGVLLVSAPNHRHLLVSGKAIRRLGTPVQPTTRFYVASVGKMIVATAILQQIEEGKFSLQSPAAPLVSGVPGLEQLPNIRPARISNLLDHSSGIPEYMNDDFTEAYYADPQRLTPKFAIPFAFDERPSGRPGRSHDYVNTNYVLLGDIIATADATSLDEALKQRVLEPADMRHTTVGAVPGDGMLAHGYADLEDSGNVQDVSIYAWNRPLGDGPLVTTAADLERFMFALFRDGKLLKPEMLARMMKPSVHEEAYGLGLERGEDKLGEWVGHTGLQDGFEAEVRYYPGLQAAMIFLTNGNSSSDTSILDKTAATLNKRLKTDKPQRSAGPVPR